MSISQKCKTALELTAVSARADIGVAEIGSLHDVTAKLHQWCSEPGCTCAHHSFAQAQPLDPNPRTNTWDDEPPVSTQVYNLIFNGLSAAASPKGLYIPLSTRLLIAERIYHAMRLGGIEVRLNPAKED